MPIMATFADMATSWHWQERFDALDPEDAYRRQVLKVEKQISFREWLQHKQQGVPRPTDNENETLQVEETKQIEADARFKEWVRKKQREKNKHAKDPPPSRAKRSEHDQPFVKPPSLHVNPVVPRSRTKHKTIKETTNTQMIQRSTPDQNAVVYAEWQRRKKREDRVKRQHEQLHRQLQEHANKLQHLLRWKKKDIVCAYSTNHSSKPPPHVT